MKPILDPKRDLVLKMSTLLCKPHYFPVTFTS